MQIEKLQAALSDEETFRFNFASFDTIPLPLDPEVRIKGIIPETASLFKVINIALFQVMWSTIAVRNFCLTALILQIEDTGMWQPV